MAEGWTHSLLHRDAVIELTGPECVLGRSRNCQVTVADPSVSRKHALLKPGPGHVVVRDLGSSNGTFVNDRKVVSEDVVEDGDILRVGDAELRVRIQGPGDAAPEHDESMAVPPVQAAQTIRMPSRALENPTTATEPPPVQTPPVQTPPQASPPQAPPVQTQPVQTPPVQGQPPQAPPARPQPGEATFFLQAESMKLAMELEGNEEGTPAPEAPETRTEDAAAGLRTQRFDLPPAATPERSSTPGTTPEFTDAESSALHTQRVQLPTSSEPPPSSPPQAAPPPPPPPPAPAPSEPAPAPTPSEPEPSPEVAPEKAPEPAPPEVQAYGDGPTTLEIPDIDVSSEDSIIGMPAVRLPMPDVEGEAPEVPDIDLSSEDSIIGMPAVRLPMPDVEGEAPEVPDIDLSSEDSIIGMPAIPLPLPDEGMPPRSPEPRSPEPRSPEPARSTEPEPAPSAETPAAPRFEDEPEPEDDGPTFAFDDDGPTFDLDDDAPPSFELDDDVPSFEIDEPATEEPAEPNEVRSVSTVPLAEDEDIRSLVQPLGDAEDDFSGWNLDESGSVVRPTAMAPISAPPELEPPASAPPEVAPPATTPATPPATPPAEPGPAASPAPREPRFDVPIPPATPPPKGPNDPPAPEFGSPPGFDASDFDASDFEPPDFESDSDFSVSDFAAPADLAPADFGADDDFAAPVSFDQPTTAAAPPPAADDLDFPLRQPSSELLPTLDDLTASVAPPEARPPQQPVYESSGAFAHVQAAPPAVIDSHLAGFWVRAAAGALDAVLVTGLTGGAAMFAGSQLVAAGVGLLCAIGLYLGWALAGRSPGKVALGLVIEDIEGSSRLGFLRAAIRVAGSVLSALTLGIGFLLVLFRDDRRALHDRIAGTWVRRG